jgi:acetyl esterase
MTTSLNITDWTIDGHAQAVPLRCYRPYSREKLPIVLFFHGGAFVNGALADAARPAMWLARKIPAWIVTVGYSLAPKFPFPAATEDAYRALMWAAEQAQANNADPYRIAVAGHDSGGNIAAALCAVARDRAVRGIQAQALLAPLLDPSMTRMLPPVPSDDPQPGALECARAYRAYLPRPGQRMHPYAAPLESRRLASTPPAFIATAEHDSVRVEGETYARELISAGVHVESVRHGGVTHDDLISYVPALDDAAAFLKRRLALSQ